MLNLYLNYSCVEEIPKQILSKCNACAINPCANNGVCARGLALNYECICSIGFYGKHCELLIDACYGDPCLNNSTCTVIQEGRFKCECKNGFKGERCEINIDDCIDNKCENGALCIDDINSYTCKCPLMYSGKFCEEKLEFCTKKMNPCKNGAKCVTNSVSNYR